MKQFFILTILVLPILSGAQFIYQPVNQTVQGSHFLRGKFDSVLHVPEYNDSLFHTPDHSAQVRVIGGSLYYYSASLGYWVKTSGGGGMDTLAFHNGGNSFGSQATIGLNDNHSLIVKANTYKWIFDSLGTLTGGSGNWHLDVSGGLYNQYINTSSIYPTENLGMPDTVRYTLFGQIGNHGGDLYYQPSGGAYFRKVLTVKDSNLYVTQSAFASNYNSKQNSLIRTSVKTANYRITPQDLVPVDNTSGNLTDTLPTAPPDRTVVGIKMIVQGSTNTVTLLAGGSAVFNKSGGGTSLILKLLNEGRLLQYDSATAIWTVLADDIPLSGLDLRYAALVSGTGYAKYSGSSPSFITAIPNSDLANSTISGISLGGSLGYLTNGFGLNTLSYNGNSGVAASVDTSRTGVATSADRIRDSTIAAGKQATLVSGTNIKTINGNSVLGSGNLTIAGAAPTTKHYLGTIFSQTGFTSTTGFTNNGATVSASGGVLNFSGGAGTFTQTLDLNYITCLERWFIQDTVIAGAKTSTSYGFAFGTRSTNTYTQCSTLGQFDMTNGSTSGRLGITTKGNLVATSASNLAFSAGDTIIFSVERRVDSFFVIARNKSTNSSEVKVVYRNLLNSTITGEYQFHNTGTFSIYSLGGSFSVKSFSVTSNEVVNAPLLCVGDSKTYGSNCDNYDYRWANLLRSNVEYVAVNAGGGDVTANILSRMSELLALAPKQVILYIGINDINDGVATGTWQSNIASIVSQFQTAGTSVRLLDGIYDTTTNTRVLRNYINATYPDSNIIHTYDWGNQPNTLSSDNFHPNNLGESLVYRGILASGKISINTNVYYPVPTPTPVSTAGLLTGSGAVSSSIVPITTWATTNSVLSNTNTTYAGWDTVNHRLGLNNTAPLATLHIGTLGVTGNVISPNFIVSGGVLGTTSGNTANIATLGVTSVNNTMLNTYGIRTASGSTNATVGFQQQVDVDNTSNTGGSIFVYGGGGSTYKYVGINGYNTANFSTIGLDVQGSQVINASTNTGLLINGKTTSTAQFDLFLSRSGATESYSVAQGSSLVMNNSTTGLGYLVQTAFGDMQFINAVGATFNERMRLKANGNLLLGSTTQNSNGVLQATGDITEELGGAISIVAGTNASTGTATLSSGTVTVSTNQITTGSQVLIEYKTGTALSIGVGNISTIFYVPTITAGFSFVINALTVAGIVNATDNSTIQWTIIKQK